MLKLLKSKTVWGGIIAGMAQILPVLDSGIFGPKAQAISTGIGFILGGIGIKSAIEKKK